ncbi:hypothetical protein Pmani_032832 [Petrolisthes manimaculis]|uniref:Uncharacterized protein n=1 Tax=Petrolisthes manimaculis TaxID=1843537 RepID=A0AAE1TR19_9EUCA|nr:hypothetical protein Pmani_032832 [Petrolisthes manimaculis]
MPDRKSVLPVSTLCVELITQLLIEIITVSKYTAKKVIPPIKREAITGTRVRNAMAKMSANHHRHPTGNGPQQPGPTTTPLDTMLEQTTQNTTPPSPPEQPSQNTPPQPPPSPPQDTPPEQPSHDTTSESTIPGTPSDISPESPTQSIPPPSPPQQDTSSECTQDPSSEPTSPSIPPIPPSLINTEQTRQNGLTPEERQKRVAGVVKELGSLLESLSHVALHTRLFTTVAAGLDMTYMKDKRTRPAIQDIIVQFIGVALRELDFGKARMFSELEMCKILFEHLDSATRLESLIIDRSCYWRSQVFENLNDKLRSLPHLTVLRIQYICTPEIIKGLSEMCPVLCDLSVRGSEKITDLECDEIAKCTGLRSLDISGTRITGRGCWKVLDKVKELSWLHHCAFNCNSDSLLFESRADLFDYVKKQLQRGAAERIPTELPNLSEATFSLKNFWLFNPFTSDLMTTTLCPQLTHLRLDFIFQDLQEEPDVSVLASLTQLNKLEVNFYDRCSVDLVSQMIEGCGPHLTCLHLHLADDWFYAAQVHNVVATFCPNLITLTFSGDYKARHTLEECNDKLDLGIPSPAHPKLKHLKLTGVVSDQRLRFMLLHCPSLQTLHLDGELEWLHDATFTEALQHNPLPHLEELWFNVSTTVTLATVALVLKQDNRLANVGRLCHMADSTMEQYQLLRSHVNKHNLNVKLIWVTDERCNTETNKPYETVKDR